MPKNIKPLIGASIAYSVTAGTGDISGATIRSDYPPGDENIASAFIHNDGGGGNVVIRVKYQLYSGVEWSSTRDCVNAEGEAITFNADSNTDIDVNLYDQADWKLADAWRIVLERDSSTLLTGNATAVVR